MIVVDVCIVSCPIHHESASQPGQASPRRWPCRSATTAGGARVRAQRPSGHFAFMLGREQISVRQEAQVTQGLILLALIAAFFAFVTTRVRRRMGMSSSGKT